MASRADMQPPVTGRVDSGGRLVAADPALAALQVEAGSSVGAVLALPQLAALARLVRKLGIAVSRPALVAANDHDVEMWVRAEPDGEDVLLSIEKWKTRRPAPARLDLAAGDDALALAIARHSWETDGELRFTSVSGEVAGLLGIAPAEAVGQPLTRYLRLEEDEAGAMPLITALASRSPFSGQQAAVRNGTARVILSGEPIESTDGGFVGFRGRALADHIALPTAANEGIGATLIDPALDQALRSPLKRIIAAAEGIVDRSDGPLRSDYAAYAGDIAAAARHLVSVIRSMVDQPAEGADVIDLSQLAAEAIGLVQPQADEREVVLELGGETALPVHGEPRGVIQILVNLINNAVRHSPPGAVVSVSIDREGGTGRATIADQGPGIAPADQKRVFEKFERLEGSEGGAGLGLTISRRLAHAMQGDISLVSAPGEGARFTLALPLA